MIPSGRAFRALARPSVGVAATSPTWAGRMNALYWIGRVGMFMGPRARARAISWSQVFSEIMWA